MPVERARVAVCHPRMGQGGSEITAMHVLQALAGDHDVTLVTTGKPDLAALDRWSATQVAEAGIEVATARLPWYLRGRESAAAWRGAHHLRHLRRIAASFDVMIGAYNLIDVGIPAVHLIADFSWDPALRRQLDTAPTEGVRAWAHREGWLRAAYDALVRRVAPPTGRDLFAGEDLVLANSQWSGALLKKHCGLDAEVLYPPVPFAAVAGPWSERAKRFVTIGRVSPEKRIETMVEILSGVRARGHRVEFDVAGAWNEDAYGRSLRERLGREAPWVRFLGPVVGEAKSELLVGNRYGLHARAGEPFGIAVAEMVRAGMIVFVPSSGGQAEIVGDAALRYDDVPAAVDKIVRVLGSKAEQATTRAGLERTRDRFDNAHFAMQIRAAVARFLARR
ncbi:MAG: glycosyltransferase family 4 protein [Planctomycetota bacterium]|nr:glycosyltransferase family 4 protein [Planctomycetota bacterium]